MEFYIDKNGKRCNVYNCGKKKQEEMSAKGWRLKLSSGYNQTPQEIYDEMAKHYIEVKIYWCGTRIPGLHDYFAFVR